MSPHDPRLPDNVRALRPSDTALLLETLASSRPSSSTERTDEQAYDDVVPVLAPELAELVDRLDAGGDHEEPDLIEQWLSAASDSPWMPRLDAVGARAVTAPWRALLHLVGDDLKLTGAGYLPPAVVTALVEQLPLTRLWGKGNREEHTPVVADLHETARTSGLVRKTKGHLVPTALGRRAREDPAALAETLVARLVGGTKPFERHASWLAALAAAGGAVDPYDDIARFLDDLGWRLESGDRVERHHARRGAHHTRAVLSLAGWNPSSHADLAHDPRAQLLARRALVSSSTD